MANLEIDAGEAPPREGLSLDFSFVVSAVWPLLLAGFVFRVVLGAIPGTAFDIDTGTFSAWSARLADNGPWNFYAKDYFSDYAPGYLYVLWFIGELNERLHFGPETFEFILKLPSIFADIGIAWVLYKMLEGQRTEVRLGAAAVYLLFPPAILMGAVWGQVDSLSVFFLMLSIYWISRDRPMEGAAAYVVGFVIKPQIIAALPFLAFWIMRKHPPAWAVSGRGGERGLLPETWLKTAAVGFAVLLLLILPFFPERPWDFITHLKDAADVENYRVGSFWAYNFWGIQGFFKPDNVDSCLANPACTGAEFWGIEYRYWGIALFAVVLVVILYVMRNAEGDWALALGTALCLLAFYMFLTRMHERYMFPALVPFLVAVVLSRSPVLWATFTVLTVMQFLNLYQVYAYYQPNDLRVDDLYKYFEKPEFLGTGWQLSRVLSLVTFLAFPVTLVVTYLLANPPLRRTEAR